MLPQTDSQPHWNNLFPGLDNINDNTYYSILQNKPALDNQM